MLSIHSLARRAGMGKYPPRRRREENAVLTPILDPAKIRPAWMRQIGFITRFPAGRQE
jgi:hypothetical protein